jgi:acyl-[acyl-carrier-protein]-phospholipid O-acyltransferase/long-chain-fatty-acid--[acyl-carrier-protein] ligase
VTSINPPSSNHHQATGTRGFWALIVTQAQGAFSDNALKQLALFIGISLGFGERQQDRLIMLAMALLTLPFIFFSMLGGSLASRFSKRSVTIAVKCFEILVMCIAAVGLARQSLGLVLMCLFFMGLHSAIFGPSKYGSLPELLPEKKLSWGNGVLELGTFLGIVLGMQVGGLLSVAFEAAPGRAGMVLVGLAVFGLMTACLMTPVPAANPAQPMRWNFVGDLAGCWRLIRKDRVLRLAVIGNTFLWFMAALLSSNLFAHGEFALHCDKSHINHLWIGLSIGIGLGSVAAGYLSGGKIEYGLVPLGLMGMTLFAALLGLPGVGYDGTLWFIGAVGFFTGFFAVPVNAIMQHRPRKEDKGGILAAANLISSAAICVAAGLFYLLRFWPHDTRMIFLVSAALTLGALIYAVILLPDALLRFVLWCVTHSLYRIRIIGRDNVPEKGGALFVCNHVSFADALLLIAATDRPVRFMMFKGIYDKPWIKPFAKILGTIPVSSEQRPRDLIQSLQVASDAIRNGEVVCIFAEGQITRIGQMLPFRRGFERIMKDLDAPIVPVALDGVLGGPWSFRRGHFIHLLTTHCPHPVTVSFGKSLPPDATPFAVREAVQRLQVDAWQLRRKYMHPLHRNLIRMAREHPRRFAMADATTSRTNFGTVLVKSIFLARRLKQSWAGQGMVGIFLPPSVPGALANYAAFLCGKVPVNLNYTLSESGIASCARQCEIKTVVTSRKFLEKIKLTPPGELVFIEDIAAKPALWEKVVAFLMAKLAPSWLLEKWLFPDRKPQTGTAEPLDDVATVIFSSGSTGEPKGVMLSQFNLLANIEQCGEVISLDDSQRLLGILPFFHSFGFTVTLCLPVVLGAGVVYYPNPLDARSIGGLVREHEVTVLLATATFLQFYLRGVAPEDFGSLRLVVCGAEKLPERLADAFAERFGIRPLEGYGSTECSPVVAVNTRDFRAAGFYQVGGKHGKIGQPVPGMCVRIVDADDPWNGPDLPVGHSGMLLLRGPNVMLGYLGQPQKTAEVLRDGWYCTGDVAMMDEDGFLQITGRLNRFSKIGGEMVPHLKVEEKLHELAGTAEQTFVVMGVPDEKKGERLVVLHRLPEAELAAVLEKFAASDLPNLWKPKADAFHRVECFPHLGTGKLDLRGAKEMAASLSGPDGGN